MEDNNLLNEIKQDYEKAKKKPRKKVEKKKKLDIRQYFTRVFILAVLFVTGVAYGLERYVDWRAGHEWQFPAQWIGLVRKIERETINPVVNVETKSILTNQEVVDASRHPEELNMIWKLESGKGTNENPEALHNYCKSKGETNEFGWGGMQNMICFKTFQESVDRVSQWLDVMEAEMYCYYATGQKVTDCSYMDRVNIEKMY